MKISLPSGTFAIVPVDRLETFKRYAECLNGYACEITGKDAAECVSSVAHYDYEIEEISPTCFRIHKKTEHLSRHVQEVVGRWKEADSSREVFTTPICLEHDALKAKDAARPDVNGTGSGAGSFLGGYAILCEGMSGDLSFDEKGVCTGIHIGANAGSDDLADENEKLRFIVQDLSSRISATQKASTKEDASSEKEAVKKSTTTKRATKKAKAPAAKSKTK